MDASCDLAIRGKNCIRWIQEDKETGLIDLGFDCNGMEQILSFEPALFEVMTEMAIRYKNGEAKPHPQREDGAKIICNEFAENGSIKPEISVFMDKEPIEIKVNDWENPEEENPIVSLSSREGYVHLALSISQVKEFIRVLQKMIEIRKSLKELQKGTAVKAKVV